MKLKGNYRFAFILQTYLKPMPSDAPYLDVKMLGQELSTRVQAGLSHKLYDKGTVLYRIRDIKTYQDRYLGMLISCGDKNSSDPCFENFESGAIEPIKKKDNQGGSHAGHIVIDTQPKVADKPIYDMVLEKVPGLYPSKVQMFLRHEIKAALEKKLIYEDVSGKKKEFTTTIEIDGNSSHTIREALQDGQLKYVSLVGHKVKQDGHDEVSHVAEEIQQIGMKMLPGIKSDKAVSFVEKQLQKLQSIGNNDFDTMILRIETSQGVTKQATIDSETQNALEQAFYHQEQIKDFDPPLSDSIEKLRDDVIMKMIALMPEDDDAE